MDESDVQTLLDQLTDKDVDRKCHAALSLSSRGVQKAIPIIQKQLEAGNDRHTDFVLAMALIELGDVNALSNALFSESGHPKDSSLKVIRWYGDRARACLIKTYQQANGDNRYWALAAMCELRDPYYLSTLLEALHDTDADARVMAVWALGHVGTVDTVPVLQQIMNTDTGRNWFNISVHDAAQRAIDEIQTRISGSKTE